MSLELGTYVWKEWRDQRAGLARLALVLLALALAALLLPRAVAGDEYFVACFVAGALVVYALSVGSDLLAGELARDRVRFLERLPGGLQAAFAGKLAFFAASAASIALLGLLLALGVSEVRTGALPNLDSPWTGHEAGLLCVGVLCWTFATSTWVPRSALALPVSVALLAFLTWPLWLILGPVPWYGPAQCELELYAGLSLLGAPLSAWASFALGYRRRGGPRSALAAGLGVAALVLLPAWAWTGARAVALRTLDLSAPDLCIRTAVIGEGERFLFATCSRELPYRLRLDGKPAEAPLFAVVVDLATGTCEATRDAGFRGSSLGFGAAAVPLQKHGAASWLDGRTAQGIPAPPPMRSWRGLPSAAELGLGADVAVLDRKGLGYVVTGGLYDPFRRRTFPSAGLNAANGHLIFLVRDCDWVAYAGHLRRWMAFDPETGELAELLGLLAGEEVGAVATDGRLVVAGGGQMALLSPETGAREPLVFDDTFAEPVHVLPVGYGDPAVLYLAGETWSGFARLDLEAATVRRATGTTGFVRYLGGPDLKTAYVLEDFRRVVRVSFGTSDREVVFPPPAPD